MRNNDSSGLAINRPVGQIATAPHTGLTIWVAGFSGPFVAPGDQIAKVGRLNMANWVCFAQVRIGSPSASRGMRA